MFCCAPSTCSPWSDQTVQYPVPWRELYGTAQVQTPNLLPHDGGYQQFWENVGRRRFAHAFPKIFPQMLSPKRKGSPGLARVQK